MKRKRWVTLQGLNLSETGRMTGELSEKVKKEITEGRKQIKKGKTIPLEKVEKNLGTQKKGL